MNLFPHDDEAGYGLLHEIRLLVSRIALAATEYDAASRIAAAATAVQAMAAETVLAERQAIADTDDFLARIQADRQKDRP